MKGQADLLAGDKPLIGQAPGAPGDTNKYGATLARNACHFVPESWHSWGDYHDSYRLARVALEPATRLRAADKPKARLARRRGPTRPC